MIKVKSSSNLTLGVNIRINKSTSFENVIEFYHNKSKRSAYIELLRWDLEVT